MPPKVENIVWRMCLGSLPTIDRLQGKGVHCPKNCLSCNATSEDLAHVIFNSPLLLSVAYGSVLGWVYHALITIESTVDAIFFLLQYLTLELGQTMAAIL